MTTQEPAAGFYLRAGGAATECPSSTLHAAPLFLRHEPPVLPALPQEPVKSVSFSRNVGDTSRA
jgi:hypothetical protein